MEKYDKGFVKIHRKILDWEWYSDRCTRELFIYCILRANWRDGSWKGTDYKRGEFITTLPSLANSLGLSEKNVRTALRHLKKTGEISEIKTNKFRIIRVNKYDEYQNVAEHTE